MAKKKDDITPAFLKDTVKEYGEILKSGTKVMQEKGEYAVISISPALDIGLGGGQLEGTWMTLSGPPKCGKTTTAMQIAANVQKDRKIIYVDAEGRLKGLNFQIEGLDPEKFIVISPDGPPLPAEVLLQTAYELMSHPDYHGAVLIIDSISSLIPMRELEGDMESKRPGLPRILSTFTKKMGQLLPSQRGLVIAITHFITDMNGYGGAKADGGVKIQYQADTRLEIGYPGKGKGAAITPWVEGGKDGDRIGQIINWKVVCSSMGPPGGNILSYIRYGKGIDKTKEVVGIAQDVGLITQAGSWISFPFLADTKGGRKLAESIKPELKDADRDEVISAFKLQGADKAYKFICEHPESVDILMKEIRQMV